MTKTDHVARVLKERLDQVRKDTEHYEIKIRDGEKALGDDKIALARLQDEKGVLEGELELRAMQ